jgi:3-oxoadipate enol-lactonase
MPSIDAGDVTLEYEDTGGESEPVLLVHAFPLNKGQWEPQLRALGDRYRLIAVDLKGFGESDAPGERESYSMDNYARELKAVLDALGAPQATLVGLSLGGYIAFAFLRLFPDAIGHLVLADTRAEADPPEGVEKRSAQQEQVEREGTAGLIEAMPAALLGEKTRANKPDVVEELRRLMENPAAGYIGALEAMKTRPDSTRDLAGIDVPTLIMVGEEDGLTPPDFSRSMHEAIGGSQLVVIPEAGHISNLEAPDAFSGALAEFLDGAP